MAGVEPAKGPVGLLGSTKYLDPNRQLHVHLNTDGGQQLGQPGSPKRVSSPRCTACSSSGAAEGTSSPHTPSRSSYKDAVNGSGKPPWNIGTRVDSTSQLYAGGATSPSGVADGFHYSSSAKPVGGQLTASSSKKSSVAGKLAAGASGSKQHGPRPASNALLACVGNAKAACSSPGELTAADSKHSRSTARAPPVPVTTPSFGVDSTAEVEKNMLPKASCTSASSAVVAEAGSSAVSSAASPPGKAVSPGKPPAGARAGGLAGLRQIAPSVPVPETETSAGAQSHVQKPCSTTAGNTRKSRSSIQQRAKSAKELSPSAVKTTAKAQSAKTLSDSSSSPTRQQLQQLASSLKGTSLKSMKACQPVEGNAKAGGQKPRKSAVDLMLQKQLSTEMEFELKLLQWKGAAGTDAAGEEECPAAEAQHAACLLLKIAEANGVGTSSKQTDEVSAIAAAPETEVADVVSAPVTIHAAAIMGVGAIATRTASVEADGAADADASCFFSTPRRGERDMFKKHRANIKGEMHFTSKPAVAQISAVAGAELVAEEQQGQQQECELAAADRIAAAGAAIEVALDLASLLPLASYKQASARAAAPAEVDDSGSCSIQAPQHNQGHQQQSICKCCNDGSTSSSGFTAAATAGGCCSSVCTLQELLASDSSYPEDSCLMNQQHGCCSQHHAPNITLADDQEQWAQQPPTAAVQQLENRASLPLLGQEVHMLLLQPLAQEQPAEEVCVEDTPEPIQQRRPSLPVPQQQERQASLPLYLPDSGLSGFDLGLHAAQGSAAELPTPHLAVDKQTAVHGYYSQIEHGHESAALGEACSEEQQRTLQTSSCSGLRISQDVECITTGNTGASDDFQAAVSSFRRGSSALLAVAGVGGNSQLLEGKALAAGAAAAQSLLQQCFATSRSCSSADVSCIEEGCTRTDDFSAVGVHQWQQQQHSGMAELGEGVDTPRSAASSSPAIPCQHSHRPSCHARQLSMDGSSTSGSDAAALAAITAELEDIKRISCDGTLNSNRTAMADDCTGAGVDIRVNTADDKAAGSVATAADSSAQEQQVLGMHSRRVSHHSRHVSMDGCSNIGWLSQLSINAEMVPAGEAGNVVAQADVCMSSSSAQCSNSLAWPLQAAAGAAANTASSNSAACNYNVAALAGSVQDLLDLMQQQITPACCYFMPSNCATVAVDVSHCNAAAISGSPSAADSAGQVAAVSYCLSPCSSMPAESLQYHSTESDAMQQGVNVIWNQMYDFSLAGGKQEGAAAADGRAEAEWAAPCLIATEEAAACGQHSDTAGTLVQPADASQGESYTQIDHEGSLPPLEAASSLVCMGSSSCVHDSSSEARQAADAASIGPLFKDPASHTAAVRAADGTSNNSSNTAGAAASNSSDKKAITPKDTDSIALLLDMKQLLEEDVALLRSSLDSLRQPSPTVQQHQHQQQQQQCLPAMLAATAAAVTDQEDQQLAGFSSTVLVPELHMHKLSAAAVSPQVSVQYLLGTPMPCQPYSLSSKVLQQLYPAAATGRPISSRTPAPALCNSSVAAGRGLGTMPNQWGFAAAEIVQCEQTICTGDVSKPRASTAAMESPHTAAPAAQRAMHRTLTSRVRSLLGDHLVTIRNWTAATADTTAVMNASGPHVGTAATGTADVITQQSVTGVSAQGDASEVVVQVVLHLQLPGNNRTPEEQCSSKAVH